MAKVNILYKTSSVEQAKQIKLFCQVITVNAAQEQTEVRLQQSILTGIAFLFYVRFTTQIVPRL